MKPHKCYVPPELPSSQIAIYFAQTTQPFIITIVTCSYIVPSELPSSQIAIYFAQITQPSIIAIASYIAS